MIVDALSSALRFTGPAGRRSITHSDSSKTSPISDALRSMRLHSRWCKLICVLGMYMVLAGRE